MIDDLGMKYIRKTYCNTFQIEKNLNGKIISYGSFKDLKQAKEYRDLCVEKDWDDSLLPRNNFSIIYPLRYIRKTPSGKYSISKKINGRTEYFGVYETLAIAVQERDLLVKYDWDYNLLCEHG